MTDRSADADLQIFDSMRPTLLAIGYRILGSRADAEDAAQDAYLSWRGADRAEIENPAAWLTTIYTRRCIDVSRSAQRRRVEYVGAWLPEPIASDQTIGDRSEEALAASLNTAFLLLLERLTPKERAAYLLREIFDADYAAIADALELQEAACRQLVSRAKRNIGRSKPRATPPQETQRRLLTAFRNSVETGDTNALSALLSEDIRLTADGGGKARALLRPLSGKDEVLLFISRGVHSNWRGYELREAPLNGALGLLLIEEGRVAAAATFDYDETGAVREIFIVCNPDKLGRL